jgi:NDP-sugar pyrophosphorylase family protein
MADQLLSGTEQLEAGEQALIAAVTAGRRADLRGETIRASILRELVTESRADWPLAPVGVSVYNATIEGTLDLEGCAVTKPLVFLRCTFKPHLTADVAIGLRDAQLKRIAFYDCTIGNSVKADRVHIESALFLTGSRIAGMVRLRGATIGEALAMDGATIEAHGETCILADGLRLGGPWILRAASVVGGIRLAGARIAGGLLWEEARIKHAGVAVNADGAIGEGVWVLRRAAIEGAIRFRGMDVKAIDAQDLVLDSGAEAFNGRGADIRGDLILDGAKITGETRLGRTHVAGELSARGAVLIGPREDWALAAAGIVVDQGIALAGAKIKGGLSLAGARIGQGLSASNVEIDGHGRAIEADVMRVRGNWIMRGAKINGSVRFAGAEIDGQLGFTQSRITGSGDLAIRADGAHIRGGWFMGRAEIRGLIRLPAARLGNEMRLRATKVHVSSGPALFASGVQIARELVLDGGFEATGAIVLDHAVIDGTLDLCGSRIVSAALSRGAAPRRPAHDEVLDARYDEAAMSLVDARLDRLVMPDAANERPRGIVDLSRAHVGSFEDAAVAWPPRPGLESEKRGLSVDGRDIDHLVLDGFVYDHLENPTGLVGAAGTMAARRASSAARMRTFWLEGQSSEDLDTHFKPQAWVALSRRLAAQGYHEDAREIAIALRRRHRKSASASRSARLQGWFLDVFALYGFNPWRTILWMIFFVCLFASIWSLAAQDCARSDCKDERVFVMALKGNYGQDDQKSETSYPSFNPLAYSLDVFLPFVDFGFKYHWMPNTSHRQIAVLRIPETQWLRSSAITLTMGGVLYALYVLEMVVGLVLTSLAVTAFTGLLRGTEDPR